MTERAVHVLHDAVLQVTGANLVPFTLQKQNAVSTAVADLLSFAAVFSVRMVSVDQSSPGPGLDISSANVSLVVQQDASAIFVGQASCIFWVLFAMADFKYRHVVLHAG